MAAPESNRIVITGIGLCTPLGHDRETSWRNIVAGKSAVRWLTPPHWTESTRIAGAPVKFPAERLFRHSEPLVELAKTTASESLQDAGLSTTDLARRTVGIVFGNSKGGLHTFSRLFEESLARKSSRDSIVDSTTANFEWLDFFSNRAAGAIRELVGGYGPMLCPVAACATGLIACQRGVELLQNDDCDVVLVGSADVSLQPAVLGSFRRLGVLSHETDVASVACRPFDRHRSGFVVGEGAACLVLEKRDSAVARGAKWYAEWLGGMMLSDPIGLTQLDLSGSTLKHLLRSLLSNVDRRPDYINLHGTATPSNDLVESRGIRDVFGEQSEQIACSSLKGGLGHLLGAAGSVELAATALALRDQIAPASINLVEPDPECRLKLVANRSRPMKMKTAWKLSLGFGGHIAGAALAAPMWD